MAASIKVIKSKIQATKKTSQITKAMNMVSASKLKGAEKAITNYLPFIKKIESIVANLVSADDVRGIYTGKWNGFGKAFKFLQTSNGFLLCVVLPIALFFVIELLLLVLNFMKIKQEKRDKQHALDMERIKQEQQAQLEAEKARIRAEILAEQAQKEKEEENK